MITKKILAYLILVVFICNFSQITVFAEGTELSAADQQQMQSDKYRFSSTAVNDVPANYDSESQNINALNSSVSAAQSWLQTGSGPDWLKRTTVRLGFSSQYNTLFSIDTIQPFVLKSDATLFWQASYNRDSQNAANHALNFGLGYRKVVNDSAIIGINAFVDQALANSHTRAGIGEEVLFSNLEVRSNQYIGLTNPVFISTSGGLDTYERVVNGIDYEIGGSAAFSPWLGLFLQGSHWWLLDDDQTIVGNTNSFNVQNNIGMRANLALTQQFEIEAGISGSYGGGVVNKSGVNEYIKVNFNLASDAVRASLFGPKISIVDSGDVHNKLLQIVRRENIVMTQQYKTPSKTMMVVAVQYADSSPAASVPVVATQTNGECSTTQAQTDINGNASFQNLNSGNYNLTAVVGGNEYTVSQALSADTNNSVTILTQESYSKKDKVSITALVKYAYGVAVNDYTAYLLNEQGVVQDKAGINDGKAVFKKCPPGRYSVRVYFNNDTDNKFGKFYETEKTEYAAGEYTALINNVNVPATVTLKVKYSDRANSVVDNSKVTVASISSDGGTTNIVEEGKTDKNGCANFNQLLAGSVEVTVFDKQREFKSVVEIKENVLDDSASVILPAATFNIPVGYADSTPARLVNVVVQPQAHPELAVSTTTNGNGLAVFDGLTPNIVYDVYAKLNGEIYGRDNIIGYAGEIRQVKTITVPKKEIDATVNVHVAYDNATAVEQSKLVVSTFNEVDQKWQYYRTVYTDATGNATFPALGKLRIEEEYYGAASKPVFVDVSKKAVEQVNISKPSAKLALTVYRDGVAVDCNYVEVARMNEGKINANGDQKIVVKTKKDGTIVTGLPIGRYQLLAVIPGMQRALVTGYELRGDQQTALNISAGESASVLSVNANHLTSNVPAEKANLTLYRIPQQGSQERTLIGSATTDINGKGRFAGLEIGWYYVQLDYRGYKTYTESYVEGERIISFASLPSGNFTVYTANRDQRLSFADVTITRLSEGNIRANTKTISVKSDADGVAPLWCLPAGDYSITAKYQYPDEPLMESVVTKNLAINAWDNVTIDFGKYWSVAVDAKYTNNVPVAGVNVEMNYLSAKLHGVTDANGQMIFTQNRPFSGALSCDYLTDSQNLGNIKAGYNSINPVHVTYSLSNINVRALSRNAKPLALVEVSLLKNNVVIATHRTDFFGSVAFGELTPGKYTLKVGRTTSQVNLGYKETKNIIMRSRLDLASDSDAAVSLEEQEFDIE
ncbi:MAG: inverse autotransporter beta domain-containing protein [Bacillota bacterium]